MADLSEMVGAVERKFHFYPKFHFMGDSFFYLSVETDGKWVDHLVRDQEETPRFRFWHASSDLTAEDRNDVWDFDNNNASD